MRSAPQRTLLAVALSGLALVGVAGPAAAHEGGDGDTHRGKVGRYAFIDSKLKPGARCIYEKTELVPVGDVTIAPVAAAELVGVGVRPPKLAAIDRTDKVDRQRVAWRFILQERVGKGDWTRVRRSPLQIHRTTDQHAARFSRMAVRHDGNPEAEYRVVTKGYWLRKHRPLKRIGAVSHIVDYYKVRGEITKGSCPGGIPVPVAPAVS